MLEEGLVPVKRRVYAVLSELREDTVHVRSIREPSDNPDVQQLIDLWHRPSRWRGFRPGQGIHDDARCITTLCGQEQLLVSFEQTPEKKDEKTTCISCDLEYMRLQGRVQDGD